MIDKRPDKSLLLHIIQQDGNTYIYQSRELIKNCGIVNTWPMLKFRYNDLTIFLYSVSSPEIQNHNDIINFYIDGSFGTASNKYTRFNIYRRETELYDINPDVLFAILNRLYGIFINYGYNASLIKNELKIYKEKINIIDF